MSRAEVLVLVTVLLSAFVSQSAGNFSCNNFTSPDCKCLSESPTNVELSCPQIGVKVNLYDTIQLQCNHISNFTGFSALSGSVGDIDKFILRFCPLPDTSIKDLMTSFGIRKIKMLTIVSYNSFNDSLRKKHLEKLYDVTSLILNHNGLTMLPTDIFEDMGNLTFLDMKNNNISLPKGIFDYTPKLEVLELGMNTMAHLDPGIFKNLDHLRLLNLWGNRLVDLTRAVFSDVPNLELLDLNTNFMETIRPDIFADLTKLQKLNLFANAFYSLPQGLLSRNVELEEFKMHENKRPLTSLPFRFLSNLPKLKLVKLNGCKLASLPEDLFAGSRSITHLHLQQNSLSTLPEKIFMDLENIEVLDLSRNHITNLPSGLFSRTKKLKQLKLNHNQLTQIPVDLFLHLEKLEYLDLKRNLIKEIKGVEFSKLVSLKTVNISDNQLSVLASDLQLPDYGVYSVLKGCKELVDIQLANNSLTEFYWDFKLVHSKLQILNLSHNNINSTAVEDFDLLSNSDVVIILSDNKIKYVDFWTAKTIAYSHLGSFSSSYERDAARIRPKTVKLDNNPFVCDCKILPFVQFIQNGLTPEVQYLFNIPPNNLNCNEPKGFENIALKDVPLESLTCPFKDFSGPNTTSYTCPDGCTCEYRSLDKGNIINCENLGLQHLLPLTQYHHTNHIELNLRGNKLVEFKAPESKGYANITHLNLSNNQLEHFNTTNLSKKIKVLDLSNNELKTLAPDVISFLNDATELDKQGLALHNNPWVCDCSIIPLIRLIKDKFKHVKVSKNITCSDGRVLETINESSLCPEEASVFIAISVMCAVFGVLLALLTGLYYRYRTEIHIYCYSSKWKILRWLVSHPDLDVDKKYDAFISYSHQDEQFVTNQLVPYLEEHGDTKYKLCLHYRDWKGGESIPDQILHSVQHSRRTIVVLSPSFLESVWGKVEFRTAHSEALNDGTARVIIILYEDVGPVDDLDEELKAYLRMNTYIKWGSPWFWQQLHYSLPHPPENADDIRCIFGCFSKIKKRSGSHEVLQNIQLKNGEVHYNVPDEPENKNNKDSDVSPSAVNNIMKSQQLIIESLDTKPAQLCPENHQNGTALIGARN